MRDYIDNFLTFRFYTPMVLSAWAGFVWLIWVFFGLFAFGFISILVMALLMIGPPILVVYYIDRKEAREQVEMREIEDKVLQKSEWWKK